MDTHETKNLVGATMGRSIAGTIGGAAAIVLAILGLLGVVPNYLIPIATIAIGITLLFKGATIAAEYPKLLSETTTSSFSHAELTSGVSIELLAGAAGIVLGILALLGIKPLTLSCIAVIVFGCGLVAGSGVISHLNTLKSNLAGIEPRTQHIIDEFVSAATGTQILVGLAAIVLGILSLIGIESVTLVLIALLVIGVSSALSGSAITGKMIRMLR